MMNSLIHPDQDEWIVAYARSKGTSHAETGQPCQDAADIRFVPHGKRKFTPYTVVLAVADGAGSAERSDEGSQLAVTSALDSIENQLRPRSRVRSRVPGTRTLKKVLNQAFVGATEAICKKAACDRVATRQYATTLLVVITVGNTVAAGQTGDGAIVARTNGQEYDILLPPQRGQYHNETAFITDQGSSPLVMAKSKTTVDRIAIFTDGLENLVIAQADGRPHPPFFDGLFGWIETQNGNHETANNGLQRLLDAPKTRSRTNDDLSIAVVCRNARAGRVEQR